jgi:DNA-binding CsgD family transcriptional regulator
MDQVLTGRSRAQERLERFVTALGNGIILIDADGEVIWMDRSTRERVNGGLRDLELPIPRADALGPDCFVAAIEITISGKRIPVCVIQEVSDQDEHGTNLTEAIEAAVTDTSWFTRALIDTLKGWRQTAPPRPESSDLHSLTHREREILGLICEGRGDDDMSKILNLSRNTVRNHVASLYRKIGVNRRSAAIIWARERGIAGDNVLAHKRLPPGRPDRNRSE